MAKRTSVNAHRHQFAITRSRQHETYINFNRKVVGPAGIDDIFQDELILGGEKKNKKQETFVLERGLGNFAEHARWWLKVLKVPSLVSR